MGPSYWNEGNRKVFPRWGVIDLPSVQINDFLQKKEKEKIDLVADLRLAEDTLTDGGFLAKHLWSSTPAEDTGLLTKRYDHKVDQTHFK